MLNYCNKDFARPMGTIDMDPGLQQFISFYTDLRLSRTEVAANIFCQMSNIKNFKPPVVKYLT